MRWFLEFYRSYVGKKVVMAVTGIIVFGFVLVHMMGNLKLYQGPETFNAYAQWLREMGKPFLGRSYALWIFRVGLIAAFGLHILSAYQVTVHNWRARPVKYSRKDRIQMGYAERTMRWGGVILGLFILYHLAHLTWGFKWVHPTFAADNVYQNVIAGFKIWWVSGIYIAAQVFLGLHMYHGLWSMFQSLGWSGESGGRDWRRLFSASFATVVAVGNISFPVSVQLGLGG